MLDETMAMVGLNKPAKAVIEWCVSAIICHRRSPHLVEAGFCQQFFRSKALRPISSCPRQWKEDLLLRTRSVEGEPVGSQSDRSSIRSLKHDWVRLVADPCCVWRSY